MIKGNLEPPHTRNLVRTNRNARLQMYERCWKAQPAIGEDHRHPLRKAVRARLMQHFDVQVRNGRMLTNKKKKKVIYKHRKQS